MTYLVKLAENWKLALRRWAGFIRNEPQIRIMVMALAVISQEFIWNVKKNVFKHLTDISQAFEEKTDILLNA